MAWVIWADGAVIGQLGVRVAFGLVDGRHDGGGHFFGSREVNAEGRSGDGVVGLLRGVRIAREAQGPDVVGELDAQGARGVEVTDRVGAGQVLVARQRGDLCKDSVDGLPWRSGGRGSPCRARRGGRPGGPVRPGRPCRSGRTEAPGNPGERGGRRREEGGGGRRKEGGGERGEKGGEGRRQEEEEEEGEEGGGAEEEDEEEGGGGRRRE